MKPEEKLNNSYYFTKQNINLFFIFYPNIYPIYYKPYNCKTYFTRRRYSHIYQQTSSLMRRIYFGCFYYTTLNTYIPWDFLPYFYSSYINYFNKFRSFDLYIEPYQLYDSRAFIFDNIDFSNRYYLLFRLCYYEDLYYKMLACHYGF